MGASETTWAGGLPACGLVIRPQVMCFIHVHELGGKERQSRRQFNRLWFAKHSIARLLLRALTGFPKSSKIQGKYAGSQRRRGDFIGAQALSF